MPTPEANDIIQTFRRRDAQKQLRRVISSVRSKERLIEQFGEDLPPDQEPSALRKIGEALDFAGRPTRGLIQSIVTGDSEFQDRGLTTGEFLRETDALGAGQTLRDIFGLDENATATRITRGVTGFVGDVLQDPLTFLTFGTAGVAKIGTAAVSGAATKIATGVVKNQTKATARQLAAGLTDDLTETIFKKNVAAVTDKLDDTARSIFLQRARKEAGGEVAKRFSAAETFLKARRAQSAALKGLKEVGVDPKEALALNEKLIQATKDLKIVDASTDLTADMAEKLLDPLFAKPALRVRSLFAPNAKPSSFSFPLLNSATTNIPVLTKATELLNGKLYNANLKVGSQFRSAIRSMEEAGGTMAVFAEALKTPNRIVKGFGRLVSQRIKAGGTKQKQVIDQQAVSKIALQTEVLTDVENLFKGMSTEEMGQLGQIFSTFMSNKINIARRAAASAEELFNFRTVEFTPDDLSTLQNIVRTQMPDKADEAVRALDVARDVFSNQLDEALQHGFIDQDQVIKEYLPLVTRSKTTAADVRLERMLSQQGLRAPQRQPFTMDRVFESLEQAKAAGFEVETNLKHLVAARIYQQRLAVLDKQFMERMAYEFGMTPDGYAELRRLANSNNKKVRDGAIEVARSRGFDIGPEAAIQDISSFGLVKTSKGNPITEETYDAIRAGFEAGDPVARREALQARLDFAVAEGGITRQQITDGTKLFEESNARLVQFGRDAEDLTSRASTRTINPRFMQQFAKNFSPEERKFWSGVIPKGLSDAVNESMQRRNLIRETFKSLRASGQDALADVLEHTFNNYTGFVRMLKWGVTIPWPSHHARNLAGGQFQQLDSVSVLGEAFSPLNWNRNFSVIHRGKDLVGFDGTLIPNKQIVADLREFLGTVPTADETIDVYGAYGDMLAGAFFAKAPRDAAPGAVRRLMSKGMNTLGDFTRKIESAGRSDLYLNLRRRGFDHVSATQQTLQTMVNYARGKTAFERDVLNNLFFFYSFMRTETSNTIKSMFTSPGKLTTQLHAIDGVKEMLMQDSNFEVGPEIEEFLLTNRKDGAFARVIGQTEAGLPEVLLGIGAPIEETFQFFDSIPPVEKTPLSALRAVGKSGINTAQTIISSLNPLLKAPIEAIANRNFFFDRPLDDKSLRKIRLISEDWSDVISHPFDKIPEAAAKGYNALTKALLRLSPNGDGSFTADSTMLVALSTFIPTASRVFPTMNALNQPDTEASRKVARLLSGIRTFEVDAQKSKAFDRLRQLDDFIDEKGIPSTKKEQRRVRIIERLRRRQEQGEE